jgi:hypothetical protein
MLMSSDAVAAVTTKTLELKHKMALDACEVLEAFLYTCTQ